MHTATEPSRAPETSTEERSGRLLNAGLVVMVLAGIAVRIWVLRSPLGRPDSDEAVVGLMANAFHHGHFATYFWGQNYGGTLETGLVSIVYALTGTSTLGLKIVPIVLNAGACLVLWRIGRRTVREPAARFAAALFWVYPPAFVWGSTKSRGFYQVGLTSVLLVVLFALRLREQVDRGRLHTADLLALGFFTGLAVWTTPQSFYVLGPIGVWLAWRARSLWKQAWPVIPAGLVGGIFWFVFVARNGKSAFSQATLPTTLTTRLRRTFTELLPRAFGGRIPIDNRWLGGLLGEVLYGVLLVLLVVLVLRRLRDGAVRRALEPVLVIVVAYPFLASFARLSAITDEPRYAFFLSPFVVLLIAAVVTTVPARVVVGAAAVVFSIVFVGSMLRWVDDHPQNEDIGPPKLSPVEHLLAQEHIDRVYADYWIANRLALDTDQRIKASPVLSVRDQAMAAEVASAPKSTYVVYRSDVYDTGLATALRRAGVPFRRLTAGEYAVYELDRNVGPARFQALWALSP